MEDFVRLPDGATLWIYTEGHGPPLVLLNGGPGLADYLQPVSTLLADACTVHRYEPRACGRSSPAGPHTLAQAIADLESLRRHWGHERWIVTGHSWGADLALAYALHHPGATRAVIGLAGGRVVNDRAWHAAYAERRHTEEMPTAAAPNLDVNRALTDDWRAFCCTPDLLHRLSVLETPCLFVFGEHDIRPSWPTEQICALLPEAAYMPLAGADHYLWRGNPQGLAKATKTFLKALAR
ncbi:MAG: alpha/beta hydrolase [Rhodospirillaceae bacterium]|nr:alpha/beta hydrolase [Rhodospirillaceae bacterium]